MRKTPREPSPYQGYTTFPLSTLPRLVTSVCIFLVLLLSLLLAACDSNQSPTPPRSTSSCGTVTDSSSDYYDVEQAATCFWWAYQHCQSTSLTYHDQDKNVRVFTLEKHNTNCIVSDTVQQTKSSDVPVTYTCSKIQFYRGGSIEFRGCGQDGRILVLGNPDAQ